MNCAEKNLLWWLTFGSMLMIASPGIAEDISWNGFATTGLSASNRSEAYSRGITKTPSMVSETTLGLNLSKQISTSTKVAAQLVAKEDDADSAVKADWIFLTYQAAEPLSLTVGKQRLPVWMVSSYFDVGVTYPWAHPPEEVYSLFNLKSFTGASLRYELDLGKSVLTFEPYGGETVLEAAPNAPTKDSKITGQNLFGANLEWDMDKTTIRAAYNRTRWNLNLGEQIQFGERRLEVYSYGISTKVSGFLLMSEYAATKDLDENKYQKEAEEAASAAKDATAAGDTESAAKLGGRAALLKNKIGGSKGYYVTGGYQFSMTALILTFASLTKEPAPGVNNSQRSLALGTNFDLTPESVLKAEVKRISLSDDSVGLFKAPASASSKLNRANIYTVNYSVVF